MPHTRKRNLLLVAVIASAIIAPTLATHASADPCGMVPPITIGVVDPIARVGDQITYVFYKDGIETFVIRPGFTGKVEEFGMLIPFPTPPAIRKSADQAFQHIAAAVDPPEVVVNLNMRFMRRGAGFGGGGANVYSLQANSLELKKEEVKVLREEAVGMYEVAVLEAGSAAALQRWMDEHGYQYPEGMDGACEDYVQDGWCFVAVKTKVGPKGSVDPKPGMREVDSSLPDGASFDGHVQGMAFRFHSDELVVPMRLASFNKGELRNIVYLLTDSPRKIRSIPEEYVVRQLSGEDLLHNLTSPLPLRVIGGTEKDIPDWQRQNLPQQRDPKPHNGIASDLFASDLLAVNAGRLSHPHEEMEKMYLRIGESLMLRGEDIDRANHDALEEQRKAALGESLKDIEEMTLTVVDGDFPREVMAASNLKFVKYSMPAQRNNVEMYDAKVKGPRGKLSGNLYLGALPQREDKISSMGQGAAIASALALLGLSALGLCLYRGWRKPAVAVVLLALAVTSLSAGVANAQAQDQTDEATILRLIAQFDDAKEVDAATEAIIKIGEPAVKHLAGEALEGEEIVRRGWAIDCLAKIGGEEADKYLQQVIANGDQPELVRTWAVAARVQIAKDVPELVALAQLVPSYPAVGRPIGMRLVAALNDAENPPTVEDVIEITVNVPQLEQTLGATILGFGVDPLVEVMTQAENQQVRNKAAGYLGALAGQGDKGVAPAVANVYKFEADAKEVAWSGGPLWIPGIRWDQNKDDAHSLVSNLIRWHLWCDLHDKSGEKSQIHNNLRSVQLAGVVGYQSPGFQEIDTAQWLQIWGALVGQDELRKLLEEQDAADNAKFREVLANAPKK